jgi:hypothetical protein
MKPINEKFPYQGRLTSSTAKCGKASRLRQPKGLSIDE